MNFFHISFKQVHKTTLLVFVLTTLCWTGCKNDDDGNLGLNYVVVYNLSTDGTVDIEEVTYIDENDMLVNLGSVRDINEILDFSSGQTLEFTAKGVVREGLVNAIIRATPPGGDPISVDDVAFNGGELDSLPFDFKLTLRLP